MKTRIISAFPGTGKTTFYEENKQITLDSDSSEFSWIQLEEGKKVRNPDFPRNYIEHIKENIGKYEFILVSSHKEVRIALLDNCIFFYLFCPNIKDKEIYLERYKNRGNDKFFIDLINDNWYNWIEDILYNNVGCEVIQMTYNYLEDEITNLIILENGGVYEE